MRPWNMPAFRLQRSRLRFIGKKSFCHKMLSLNNFARVTMWQMHAVFSIHRVTGLNNGTNMSLSKVKTQTHLIMENRGAFQLSTSFSSY